VEQAQGSSHEPVLVAEVLALLAPSRGGLFVDCTVGLGGHTQALLEHGASRVLGLDRDAAALDYARERLQPFGERVELVHADYRRLDEILAARNLPPVDGLLADLGISSMQLDAPARGFSFRRDEPLDMRMDTTQGPTAADALREVDERTLADVIYRFGEERYSRRVARAVIEARARNAIETTGQLADLVRRAIPRKGYSRIDPATRTFQAIRIWINRELEGLDTFLASAARNLSAGGRLSIVTFHSLEDRIVKHTLRGLQADGGLKILTKRPVVPSEAETARNPRARSAKLRAAERT
jgi:16S rRNA (cytosine1402-N4)-methyltransferase